MNQWRSRISLAAMVVIAIAAQAGCSSWRKEEPAVGDPNPHWVVRRSLAQK